MLEPCRVPLLAPSLKLCVAKHLPAILKGWRGPEIQGLSHPGFRVGLSDHNDILGLREGRDNLRLSIVSLGLGILVALVHTLMKLISII